MTLPLNVTTKIHDVLKRLNPNSYYENFLTFYHEQILWEGGSFHVNGDIHLFGLGKAAAFEVKALKSLIEGSPLRERLSSCVAYTKYDHRCDDESIIQLEGTHPLISEENLTQSDKFIELLNDIPAKDTLVFLLSGGGSALLERPIDGLSFEALMDKHQELLSSGLGINEMNKARKELSLVKNGGLKDFIKTDNILQLITCDIPNDNLFDVSSGPLLKEDANDNPKSILVQSATKLISQICNSSESYINSGIYDDNLDNKLMDINSDLPKSGECLISGGELTITIPKDSNGIGGRATHFVLAMAKEIYKKKENQDIHIMAFGTDGTDGPTNAAGAYLNYELYKELSCDEYLKNYNSYGYFDKIGTLIKTGPTQSNLMDIRYIWRE